VNSRSDRKIVNDWLESRRKERVALEEIARSFDSLPKFKPGGHLGRKPWANSRISTESRMSMRQFSPGGRWRNSRKRDGNEKVRLDIEQHPTKQSSLTKATDDGRQMGPSDWQWANALGSIRTNFESGGKMTVVSFAQDKKHSQSSLSIDEGRIIDCSPDPINVRCSIRLNCESKQNETVRSDVHEAKQQTPIPVTDDGRQMY
jgi:hypothetical protein